jgi:hypothetical protein
MFADKLKQLFLSVVIVAIFLWLQRQARIIAFDRKWKDAVIPKYVIDYGSFSNSLFTKFELIEVA